MLRDPAYRPSKHPPGPRSNWSSKRRRPAVRFYLNGDPGATDPYGCEDEAEERSHLPHGTPTGIPRSPTRDSGGHPGQASGSLTYLRRQLGLASVAPWPELYADHPPLSFAGSNDRNRPTGTGVNAPPTSITLSVHEIDQLFRPAKPRASPAGRSWYPSPDIILPAYCHLPAPGRSSLVASAIARPRRHARPGVPVPGSVLIDENDRHAVSSVCATGIAPARVCVGIPRHNLTDPRRRTE